MENTILRMSERQKKENENLLRKRMFVTSFEKYFRKNPLKCLVLSNKVIYNITQSYDSSFDG